ncbi:3-deoxy-D-manno-octulosonic acid transferase [Helicobacter sp. MIT 11-5569]|uniref:lipid IV(A) 3-deoxy-D-manno-octulosonic acid transferase n=1 Tax=Helicobacter sp. MIT 11-5569 TaxID=1548151 RepID=UPI00051FB35E|nr:lipid IV(A) 3-deoxy-D-manno-octulosonic acid transferase [Helicobacter sp. MIT 11-5569]TLD81142.1 3-deoxy-D-manno-octulosonic acid transferase [Helicobacter sp. MIT 11-5569]
MVYAYYFLMCMVHFCALPFLFLLSFKQKYKVSLKKRFFIPTPLPKGAYFWIHACSFGEVKSMQSIINSLQSSLDANHKILLTTTTQTGFNLAKKLYPNCTIAYLPFESFIPFWLKGKQIISLTLTEAELWLMPLFCAHVKGAKTLLINARISTRSYPRYLRFRFFYAKLFTFIQKIFCQSPIDKTRLESLGAKNIQIFGNLKLAEIPQVHQSYTAPNAPLWVIASTHSKNNQSEEVLILNNILKAFFAKKQIQNLPHFLFAPRHPERFLEVERDLNAILQANNLPLLQKTSTQGIQNSLNTPFILLDTLGELNNLYAISYGVILGGSFLPNIGGHNPIEPAYFHTKLISGPYIFNQEALFASVKNCIICEIDKLADVLQNPLENTYITQNLEISKIIKSIKET